MAPIELASLICAFDLCLDASPFNLCLDSSHEPGRDLSTRVPLCATAPCAVLHLVLLQIAVCQQKTFPGATVQLSLLLMLDDDVDSNCAAAAGDGDDDDDRRGSGVTCCRRPSASWMGSWQP